MVTVFKGAINFGLINIPVKLSAATQKETIAFRSLHSKCKTPINQKRWCNHCDEEVGYGDLVKGYEYEKKKFVEISDEDIKAIPVKSSKYIQIADFIRLEEVDPIYYDKAYYVIPEANGEKPYLILYNAMKEKKRVAVAKISIRDKEQLCLIRVYNDILLMNTMFFGDEVRSYAEIEIEKIRKKLSVSDIENKMASEIVENLTQVFDIDKYHDAYREEFNKMITARVEGNDIIEPSEQPAANADFGDLMERLRASVEASRAAQGGKESAAEKKPAKPASKPKTAKPAEAPKTQAKDAGPGSKTKPAAGTKIPPAPKHKGTQPPS